MKSKRIPFGLSRNEAKMLREFLECELKMIPDLLKDLGYTAKQQQVHRQYQRDCRNLLKRIRRWEAA